MSDHDGRNMAPDLRKVGSGAKGTRTPDPLLAKKRGPPEKVQVENLDSGADLQRQAVEGRMRSAECLRGGPIWDHHWPRWAPATKSKIMHCSSCRTRWRNTLSTEALV